MLGVTLCDESPDAREDIKTLEIYRRLLEYIYLTFMVTAVSIAMFIGTFTMFLALRSTYIIIFLNMQPQYLLYYYWNYANEKKIMKI